MAAPSTRGWSQPSPRTVKTNVVISLALGGYDPTDLVYALHNTLDHTSAPMIVHLSTSCRRKFGRSARPCKLQDANWRGSPRVVINPDRIYVVKHSPRVLAAHLSNFLLCASSESLTPSSIYGLCRRHPETKFLMLASNQLLLRQGLEAHVSRHDVSFTHHFGCNRLMLHGSRVTRRATNGSLASAKKDILDGISALSHVASPDHCISQPLGPDSNPATRAESAFAKLLAHSAELRVAGWRTSPTATMPHEGSFYPSWLLSQFVESLRGTPFEAALLRSNRSTLDPDDRCSDRTPCRCVYEGLIRAGVHWRSTPVCALEEVLLPTFVAQRHAPLLARSSPPLILRWDVGNFLPHMDSRSLGIMWHAVTQTRTLGYLVGLKVPMFSAPQLSLYARRPGETTGRHRKQTRLSAEHNAIASAP